MMEPFETMGSTRRAFTRALAGLALGGKGAHAQGMPATAPAGLAYVGMQGSQIHALRLDAGGGQLTALGPVASGLRPTWLLAHPALPLLYAVNEDSAKEGTVSAFAVDRQSGALRKLGEVATGGAGATHLAMDVAATTLLVANYSAGSTSSIALARDGSLGERVSTLQATGSGPHRRQASPHAHGIAIAPDGRHALVADMGADRVFAYGLDPATHSLRAGEGSGVISGGMARAFAAPAGSGPRHLVFGAGGRFVYLITELSAEIITLRWDAQAGQLAPLQALPTSSPEFQGNKSGSEIAVSRDGRFVYAGNRGEHTLLAYRVDADSGLLTLVQRIASGGETPWSFALHPGGRWLLVANRNSNRLNLFSVDPASGLLADTGTAVESPAPVCITFVD